MKTLSAIPILLILSLKICELSAAIVDEQFDVYPSYFGFEYDNNLEVNALNAVLNFTSESGDGEKGIEILYPVDSSNTSTGILYATVLANNSKNIFDGGSLIDDEGEIEPYYEVGCGLGFSNFSGDGWIELKNRNGSKKIQYYGGELDVSSLDDIYLRVSYEFITNTAKSYYSMDGQNFTELGSEYAPNDNFFVSLEVETRNVLLEEGDLYFDNFVISEDANYDSTLTNFPYSDFDGIVDSDGDGVPDSEDPFPNEPLELELLGPTDFQPKDNVGWIEVSYAYMNGGTFMPGVWHPIDTNLGAWFPFDDSWPSYTLEWPNAWPYYWSSEQQTSTNSYGAVGNWSYYKTSNPYIYTCKFNWTNGTYGFGFSYDGRIDLDNDGNQDGIQIRSGLTFPAEGSQIDFHQIINSLSENLALFTLPSSFTENDFDGDGRSNTVDLDDDNDGIADAYDSTPLVYNVSKNAPSSLNGYVEIYFSDHYPSYGIWHATGENTSIDIWNDGSSETRYEDIYSWDSQNLTSTGSLYYDNTFRVNVKDKTNDLFFLFTYVWESNDSSNNDSGKGFFYDGQIDLDNNGMADGEQIANDLPFPATDSEINLTNIYDSAESNFIPIQVLDYSQNEYNSVVAERDAKLTLEEVAELRLGSTMIEVSGNQATVQLEMEQSSDLQTWEDAGTPATMTIPADKDIKFFRFKMAE